METAATRRLGDIVVERGLVTQYQLEQALAHQEKTGAKLGEVLVELEFITRLALAGVLSEQWDALGLTERGRKTAAAQTRPAAESTVAEAGLRERLEALTAELAAKDQRIAQQDATIAALLAKIS